MINKRNKQIKPQPPTPLHLSLQTPTPLKNISTPNDKRQIVRAKPGIRVWGVSVGETGRG